jgi:hypothetical protein
MRLAALALAALHASPLAAAEFVSPAAGGGGGDTYSLSCGADAVLTGVSGKWGAWLDSFGITCRRIDADGSLGAAFTRGPVGGTGGDTVGTADCPANQVVNSVWFTTGTYVNEITILCGPWSAAERTVVPATLQDERDAAIGKDQAFTNLSRVACPADGRPAKGFRGKQDLYVDSIALVCDGVVLAKAGGGSAAAGGGAGAAAAGGALAVAPGAQAAVGTSPALERGGSAAVGSAAASPGPTFTAFPSAPVVLSAAKGGEVTVVATGAGPLQIAMQVPPAHAARFELVAPPAKGGGTLGASASATRIVRFKGGIARSKGPGAAGVPLQVTVTLTVTDRHGRTTTRSFTVTGT